MSKRTIPANGEFESLQIVSKLDTGRCVSLLTISRRGVDTRRCASKDAGPLEYSFSLFLTFVTSVMP